MRLQITAQTNAMPLNGTVDQSKNMNKEEEENYRPWSSLLPIATNASRSVPRNPYFRSSLIASKSSGTLSRHSFNTQDRLTILLCNKKDCYYTAQSQTMCRRDLFTDFNVMKMQVVSLCKTEATLNKRMTQLCTNNCFQTRISRSPTKPNE